MPRPEPPRGGVRAITSLQNERVKLIRSLEMRKVRRETGLFVAEGASVLVTARDAGWKPQMLVFLAGSAAVRCRARAAGLGGGGGRGVPGGVRGRARPSSPPRTTRRPCSACSSSAGRASPQPTQRALPDSLWLALEAIRDPGNLGTIIRTVDAVGASGVVADRRTAAIPIRARPCAPPWARSSTCRWCASTPERFLAWAAAWPGDVVGTHLSGARGFPRRALSRARRCC